MDINYAWNSVLIVVDMKVRDDGLVKLFLKYGNNNITEVDFSIGYTIGTFLT